MRYLGIDLGEKRSGLAAGDDRSGIISPIGALVLPPGAALFDAIAKAAHEHAGGVGDPPSDFAV